MAINGRYLNGAAIFIAVVEAGSFARAADQLGLTASGVSRAIGRLEFRIGTKLLSRNTRRVHLTKDGRSFHDRVNPAIAEIERAALAISNKAASVRGHLRVGVDHAFGQYILAPRLAEFLDQYPDLELELCHRDRFRDLSEEGVEISIRFGPIARDSTVVRQLSETRFLTCAAPSYIERRGLATAPEELKRPTHECVLFKDFYTGEPFRWNFHREGTLTSLSPTGRLAIDSVGSLMGACLAGYGIARLLEAYASQLIGEGRLVSLLADWHGGPWPLNALYSDREEPSPGAAALMNFASTLLAGDKESDSA